MFGINGFIDSIVNRVFIKPNDKVNQILKQYREKSGINKYVFQNVDWAQKIYQGYLADIHNYRVRTMDGTTRNKIRKSMKAPKYMCQEMASLIHTNEFQVNIKGNQKVQELFDKIAKDNDLYKNWQVFTESGFLAVGGFVEKPYIGFDKAGEKSIFIDWTTQRNIVPISYYSGGVVDIAIISDPFKDDDYWYITAEEHRNDMIQEINDGIVKDVAKYVIEKKLFRSKEEFDGFKEVPWTTIFGAIPSLDVYSNMGGVNFFNYIKTGLADNSIPGNPLGFPTTINSLTTFQVLDTMFDTFFKEGLHGKIDVLVPESAMKEYQDPRTGTSIQYFDATDEVYKAWKNGEDPKGPEKVTVNLRISDFIAGINTCLKIISSQMGFSASTFSFDGTSMKTATEVITESSKTFKTKVNHEKRLEKGIKDFVEMIVNFAIAHGIEGFVSLPTWETEVIFDDSIIKDDQQIFDNDMQMAESGRMSTYKFLEKRGYSEEEIEEEIARLNEEMELSDSSDPDDEMEWIENYLIDNPDATEEEAKTKYLASVEG